MISYVFWNNKGGTGKTSLCFQAMCRYAELNPTERILAIDACPQANLSELLLGGLVGNGSANLMTLHNQTPRRTLGGYFQDRLPAPFVTPNLVASNYLSVPSSVNANIPDNIHLMAGDPILELQANAAATLANAQVPGTNTWIAVVDWIRDVLSVCANEYDVLFIDANPSFSIHTQMALAAGDRLVVPVMADDSSRRALQNAFSLIYGLQLPSPIYAQHNFASRLNAAGRTLPKVHVIARNRITQYMGEASAYAAVLRSIDNLIDTTIASSPALFTFSHRTHGEVSIRDFQTTGVVAFAKGAPLTRLASGTHNIVGQNITIKADYLKLCRDAVNELVSLL